MNESSTYRKILEEGLAEGRAAGLVAGLVAGRAEGSVEEARKFLTRLAQKYLGPPSEAQRAALATVIDVDRLERMGERAPELSTWQELLEIV